MFSRYCYTLIIFCTIAALASSCTQPETKQAVPVSPALVKPSLMAPFRYHKLIESSPGKYFDVFGWGRGKDSSGAYMILHSDSTGKQYSNTGGDLQGSIIDVYNTDMNMDGNPEILIEAKAKDTTDHVNIYAYEFKGGKGQQINFPKLTDKTKKLYHGQDNIYIKDGNLIREFPIYEGTGKDAKPTGKKKILQYGLRNNEFNVKDISPIDTARNTKAAVKDSVKKSTVKADKPKSSETKSKKTKHHHEEKKPKHRKRRRHRE